MSIRNLIGENAKYGDEGHAGLVEGTGEHELEHIPNFSDETEIPIAETTANQDVFTHTFFDNLFGPYPAIDNKDDKYRLDTARTHLIMAINGCVNKPSNARHGDDMYEGASATVIEERAAKRNAVVEGIEKMIATTTVAMNDFSAKELEAISLELLKDTLSTGDASTIDDLTGVIPNTVQVRDYIENHIQGKLKSVSINAPYISRGIQESLLNEEFYNELANYLSATLTASNPTRLTAELLEGSLEGDINVQMNYLEEHIQPQPEKFFDKDNLFHEGRLQIIHNGGEVVGRATAKHLGLIAGALMHAAALQKSSLEKVA